MLNIHRRHQERKASQFVLCRQFCFEHRAAPQSALPSLLDNAVSANILLRQGYGGQVASSAIS
jgi:hypothetical protein